MLDLATTDALPFTLMAARKRPDPDPALAFLAGDDETLRRVRSWIETVVHFQSWRFADPEGVIQEVHLKLLDIVRSRRFRGASSFKTFVGAVARNTCIDVYRVELLRHRREEQLQPAAAEPVTRGNPESAHVRRERRELARYVVQRLSENCRRLWHWVYRDGLSAREIAAKLGITPGNVRVRVHRCLQEARAIVGDYLDGGPS